MPNDNAYSWLSPASAELLSNSLNVYAQGQMNRQTRRFAREQYARQRADALSDWNMVNEYNSPQQQMARLKAAKLNPNLIYGKGADNISAPVRSSSPQPWTPKAPTVDLSRTGSSLAYQYDIETKKQGIDNLKKQSEVMTQEAILKSAQTANTMANTAKTDFDRELAQSLKEFTLSAAEQNVRKLMTETDVLLARNDREAAMNAVSVQQGLENIIKTRIDQAKSRSEIDEIKARTNEINRNIDLKTLDKNLKELGVQPGDNLFMRVIGTIINKWFRNVPGVPTPGYDEEKLKRGMKTTEGEMFDPVTGERIKQKKY